MIPGCHEAGFRGSNPFTNNKNSNLEQILREFEPQSDRESPESDRRRPPRVSFSGLFITGVPGLRPETSQSGESCSRLSESMVFGRSALPLGTPTAPPPPPPLYLQKRYNLNVYPSIAPPRLRALRGRRTRMACGHRRRPRRSVPRNCAELRGPLFLR